MTYAMRAPGIHPNLVVIRFRLADFLLQSRLSLQYRSLGHRKILVANRHAIRHLELRDSIDDHIGYFE